MNKTSIKQRGKNIMNNCKNCIDDYIAEQPDNVQLCLNQVRDSIRRVIPNAEERISWRMPTFWEKHNIIHFAAFKNHIGLYPGPDAIKYFEEDLKEYKTSKGAIQIPFDKPVPTVLIEDITNWCYQTGKHH